MFPLASRCVRFTRNLAGNVCPLKGQASSLFFSLLNRRRFATSPVTKLPSLLQAELQHEQQHYEVPTNAKSYLDSSGWALVQKDGDITTVLKKTVQNDLTVTVEFQLVRTAYGSLDEDTEDRQPRQASHQETTDFTVTCEKPAGNGAIFHCTTIEGDEKYRFAIGNVRYYASADEKQSTSAYGGPAFEDLEENVQSGLDAWLAALGIDEGLCDFIDVAAVDKEQREYMRWLQLFQNLVQ